MRNENVRTKLGLFGSGLYCGDGRAKSTHQGFYEQSVRIFARAELFCLRSATRPSIKLPWPPLLELLALSGSPVPATIATTRFGLIYRSSRIITTAQRNSENIHSLVYFGRTFYRALKIKIAIISRYARTRKF